MKISYRVRRCTAAIACALMLVLAIPVVAWADDQEPPAVLTPVPEITAPGTEPTEETTETTFPPAPSDGPTDLESETPTTSEQTDQPPASGGEPFIPSEEIPAENNSNLPAPAAPVPVPGQPTVPEVLVVEEESGPVTESATPTPMPTATPETSVAAAPAALPAPVTKAIDSVVATASGSPLYVQILTVTILLAAGFLYFRLLGSKGRRSPIKPGK